MKQNNAYSPERHIAGIYSTAVHFLYRFDEELDKSDILTFEQKGGKAMATGAPSGLFRAGRDVRASGGKATWK